MSMIEMSDLFDYEGLGQMSTYAAALAAQQAYEANPNPTTQAAYQAAYAAYTANPSGTAAPAAPVAPTPLAPYNPYAPPAPVAGMSTYAAAMAAQQAYQANPNPTTQAAYQAAYAAYTANPSGTAAPATATPYAVPGTSVMPMASITITPTTNTVAPGGTVSFTAQAKDVYGNVLAAQPTIYWYTTSGSVTNGQYTAPTTPGAYTVTAYSGSTQAQATVTVQYGAVPTGGASYNPMASIIITPNPASTNPGGTVSFTAQAKDAYGNVLATQPTFNWSATYGSINSSGQYTASTSQTASDQVVASANGIQATAPVTVQGQASGGWFQGARNWFGGRPAARRDGPRQQQPRINVSAISALQPYQQQQIQTALYGSQGQSIQQRINLLQQALSTAQQAQNQPQQNNFSQSWMNTNWFGNNNSNQQLTSLITEIQARLNRARVEQQQGGRRRR